MTEHEVELVSTSDNSQTQKETILTVNDQPEPTPLKVLFFRFASRKEIAIFFLGFLFAIVGGVLNPISYTFYGNLMNELTQSSFKTRNILHVILMFTLFMGSSSVCAFIERWCLAYYAGIRFPSLSRRTHDHSLSPSLYHRRNEPRH